MSSLSTLQCDFEAFEPRQSLWKLVEEFAPENEQREIKEILGQDIIDETSDLHREVDMLIEIWQEYRENNAKKNKEILQKCNFQRLPEPPQMRSNMKKEIQLFIKALKQRTAENGTSIDSLSLSKKEEGIVEYAFSEEMGLKRPPTASSSDNGCITPRRPTSSCSGSRSSSSLSDVMESFHDRLNVESFDDLADRLRNLLLEEKDNLIEDVAFLQNSLFEESQFTCQEENKPEPSLQELKELGIKLEKEMTKKGALPPTIRKPSHSSSPPRRPQGNRKVIRSSSSPVVSGTKARFSCENDRHVSCDSLSPSPPTSAVRRPGSVSRFRKIVLDSRLEES